MVANECKICGGAKSDHFDADGKPITQHVYTEQEGQLVSQADAAKARQAQQQPQPFALPARWGGTDAQAISKLLELLMDKGVINEPEALYIFGVGPKPESDKSGFIDPALLFGSGTA